MKMYYNMNFDQIRTLNIDEKYIKTYQRNIFKLQKLLSYPEDNGKVFHADLFLDEDISRVKDALSNTSDASSEAIICAVVKYLKECNLDNRKYVDLMRSYGINLKLKKTESKKGLSDIVNDDIKSYISKLKAHASNKKTLPGVRVLSAILASEDKDLISLNLKITTLYEISNDVSKENHINLFKNTLQIKNVNYPLPAFFIDNVKDIVEKSNLLCPDSNGNMYKSPTNASKNISFAFSELFKITYLKLHQLILNSLELQDSSLTSEADYQDISDQLPLESIQIKSDLDLPQESIQIKSDLDLPQIKSDLDLPQETSISDIKIKPLIKFKLKFKTPVNNKRSDEYEWSFFNKDKADEIHISRVKNIMMLMLQKNDKFYHSEIDSIKGIEYFKKCMIAIENLNSKVNHCNSLCKFLELTLATHYSDYTIIRDTHKLELSVQNSTRDVINYTSLLTKFTSVQSNLLCSTDLKIICLLLSEIINIDAMTTGALRFSDLAKTHTIDDNESNFLDLTNHKWYLREVNTKNKKSRVADVSKEFVAGILKLHNGIGPLICKNGKTDKISREFTKHIDVNFSDVRSSYVTYLDLKCNDIDLINLICINQGHKVSTALENYRRKNTS